MVRGGGVPPHPTATKSHCRPRRVRNRTRPTQPDGARMKISAGNHIQATVKSVKLGEVMSTVDVSLGDGQVVTAAITKASVEDLDIKAGDEVVVIIKSTEVMIAKND